jgi:hypothetical protein
LRRPAGAIGVIDRDRGPEHVGGVFIGVRIHRERLAGRLVHDRLRRDLGELTGRVDCSAAELKPALRLQRAHPVEIFVGSRAVLQIDVAGSGHIDVSGSGPHQSRDRRGRGLRNRLGLRRIIVSDDGAEIPRDDVLDECGGNRQRRGDPGYGLACLHHLELIGIGGEEGRRVIRQQVAHGCGRCREIDERKGIGIQLRIERHEGRVPLVRRDKLRSGLNHQRVGECRTALDRRIGISAQARDDHVASRTRRGQHRIHAGRSSDTARQIGAADETVGPRVHRLRTAGRRDQRKQLRAAEWIARVAGQRTQRRRRVRCRAVRRKVFKQSSQTARARKTDAHIVGGESACLPIFDSAAGTVEATRRNIGRVDAVAAAQCNVEIIGIRLIGELEESVGDASVQIEIAACADRQNAGSPGHGTAHAIGHRGELRKDLRLVAGQHVIVARYGRLGRHEARRDRAGHVDGSRAEIPVRCKHDVAGIIEFHSGPRAEIGLRSETAEISVGRRNIEILHEVDERAGRIVGEEIRLPGARDGAHIEHGLSQRIDGDADKIGIAGNRAELEALEALEHDRARAFDIARIGNIHSLATRAFNDRRAEIYGAAGIARHIGVIDDAVIRRGDKPSLRLQCGDVDHRAAVDRDRPGPVGSDVDSAA